MKPSTNVQYSLAEEKSQLNPTKEQRMPAAAFYTTGLRLPGVNGSCRCPLSHLSCARDQ